MCIIIEKRGTDTIDKAWMRAFYASNRDGWGIMHQPHGGGPITVAKGFGLEALWMEYVKLDKAQQSAVIHLRMATHGATTLELAHPFEVLPGLWLMHNGIIDAPDCPDEQSDTWSLVVNVLRPLIAHADDPQAFIRCPSFRYLLEAHMGSQNRIVLMDALGHVTFNDAAWHTLRTGMRVSNTYAWNPPVVASGKRKNQSAKYAHAATEPVSFVFEEDDQSKSAPWHSFNTQDYDAELAGIAYDLGKQGIEQIRDFVYTEPETAADLIAQLL